MAGTKKSKLKLLFLMEIFLSRTDAEHIYAAAELCEELELCGISAERKSIYSDIDALREFGFEIIHARSPKNGYYLAKRVLEPAELRLLYDAVRTAPFLTEEQAQSLLQKMTYFISHDQYDRLKRQACLPVWRHEIHAETDGQVFCYLIETLSQAIEEKKQVAFLYAERMVTPYWETRSHETERKVHPYAIMLEEGRYYLLCRESSAQPLMGLRLDRLRKLCILEEDALPYGGELRLKRQAVKEAALLEIRCDKQLIERVLLQFGEQIEICADGPAQVRARTETQIDDGLIAWLIRQGGAVEVLQPESLRAALLCWTQKILKQYRQPKSK